MKAQSDGIIKGVIDAKDEEITLQIMVRSSEIGECKAFFYIEIEDGAPVSFLVVADFIGPFVKCHHPIVDYGLVKVNSTEDFEVEIENLSPIPADILIKNSVNAKLDFHNMISMEQI